MTAAARIAGIFISPVRTLQDIAARPTWLVPVLAGAISTLAVTALVLPKMDWGGMLLKGMEQSGQKMPENQIESTVKIMKTASTVTGWIWGAVGFAVICLVIALIYFAIIRMFGGETTYRKIFAVVSWSGLIYALKGILSIVPLLGMERLDQDMMNALIPSNPAAFLTREQVGGALFSVFPFLDVFGVWQIVLTIIGLGFASNWSRGRCAATVLVPYGLIMLVVLAIGPLSS